MPVNAFPGERNWGYDGVFPSAVQHSYGGPEALARFVDAAHGRGLAVVLDVVYNHIGPEGAVLSRYTPYFTATYHTPWGDGLNFAEAGSDQVRRSFIESAVRWITDLPRRRAAHRRHRSDLRPDRPPVPRAAGRRGARCRCRRPPDGADVRRERSQQPRSRPTGERGGIGSDAAWNDDLHHTLRVALTGDRRGYYIDYDGVADLAHTLARRWVFTGRYSTFRGRHHGRPADDIDAERFVVFTSNHDHVGNTPAGARPPFDPRRRLVAAATVVLSPFTPMLFQGEEYGEPRPFPYFVDHGEPELIAAVRAGRRTEFARVEWTETVADPADPATFAGAVIDPSIADQEPHRSILAAYTELLALRRRHCVVHDARADQVVELDGDVITVDRSHGARRSVLVLHVGDGTVDVPVAGASDLVVAFDAAAGRWGTGGSASSTATATPCASPARRRSSSSTGSPAPRSRRSSHHVLTRTVPRTGVARVRTTAGKRSSAGWRASRPEAGDAWSSST